MGVKMALAGPNLDDSQFFRLLRILPQVIELAAIFVARSADELFAEHVHKGLYLIRLDVQINDQSCLGHQSASSQKRS